MSKLVFDASEYQRMEAIGRGRSETVYRMSHRVNRHEVAAKMFDFHENDEEQTKQFLREIECLMELNHQNIIKILGFTFQSSDHPAAIYMPYMKNGSLANYIYAGGLKNDTLKFIEKLANAMKYLHEHDIIHRDLKPENILINDNFEPVICDFGLSKFDDPNFTQTNGIGTPMWMAPELYEDTEYTKAVDVFSFGLICYCILSRHLPFNAKNPLYIQKKIILGEVPDLSSFKKFYQKMIKGCLANKPNERLNFEQIYQMVYKNICIDHYVVFIRYLSTYVIDVHKDKSVRYVIKKAVQKIDHEKYNNESPMGFTLMYHGITLDNEKTLGDYKISRDTTLHLNHNP